MKPTTDISKRLINKVFHSPDGCWYWLGTLTRGYGMMFIKKKENNKSITKYSHRVSYELFIGQVPEGMHVLHRCDNPLCVNPHHLFLGTNRDNVDDKIRKGRSWNKIQMIERFIIQDALRTGYKTNDIANYFKVTPSAIRCIKQMPDASHFLPKNTF
jgi:hypothetical protein